MSTTRVIALLLLNVAAHLLSPKKALVGIKPVQVGARISHQTSQGILVPTSEQGRHKDRQRHRLPLYRAGRPVDYCQCVLGRAIKPARPVRYDTRGRGRSSRQARGRWLRQDLKGAILAQRNRAQVEIPLVVRIVTREWLEGSLVSLQNRYGKVAIGQLYSGKLQRHLLNLLHLIDRHLQGRPDAACPGPARGAAPRPHPAPGSRLCHPNSAGRLPGG